MRVTIAHLTKSFGRIPALDDVSCDIAPGQLVAILGANGAGKTTLLRALAAIVAADAGQIEFDGQRLDRERLDLRRHFAFLPDQPAFLPEMTVLQHVAMLLQLYERRASELAARTAELFAQFSLLPLIDARLGTLSRGQQYKAMLVGLLAVDPELWILDEPFSSGMDPPALHAFRQHVRAASSRGRTVFYTTQIVELIDGFSDCVVVLNEGRLLGCDSLAKLRAAASPSGMVHRILAAASAPPPCA